MGKDGWSFQDGPGVIPDPVMDARHLRELYVAADPNYTGRVTVPVLWDKKRGTIVSNESSEIIRMFDTAFDGVGATPGTHRPDELADEIDAVNERVYDTVNNGVYKAGFATEQDAYERNVAALFDSLDWLEERLASQDFVVGDELTEADVRLYTTLVRFDAVYHGHFKCNVRRLLEYANLSGYLAGLYAMEGFGDSTDLHHIKHHYYESHPSINPNGIVPLGPVQPFAA